MLRRSVFLALCTTIACSSKGDGTVGTTPDSGVDPLAALLGEGPAATKLNLAAACGAVGAAKLSFAKRTGEWGLSAVRGNHIQAIDLDHDGYPDLLIQSGGSARSPVGDKQATRVLMNRPGAGGGRTFVEATVDSAFGVVREGGKPADGLLRASQLVVAADVDNDGDIDLFSGTYVDPAKPENDSSDRNEILLNDGKGKFTLAAKSAVQQVPSDVLPPTSSATFVDVDRDGVIDLFVGFWYRAYGTSYLGVQARLFKGKGDGTFTDATPGSGLETQSSGYDQGKNHRPAYGVTSCDLDDDGSPELMVSAYGRQWNLLYKNNSAGGAPAFEDVSAASGFAGDALTDYKDNQFYMCHCQITGTCEADTPDLSCGTTSNWSSVDAKPWRNNGNTFTTTCGDLNGDGKPDLYSAEIVHWHIGSSSDPSELLVNESADGAIKFGRPGRGNTGLEWPHPTSDWNEGGIMSANADLDLDGYDDIVVAASDYPGNWSMLFRQNPDAPGTFKEIGKDVGLQHICTNGLAIADFDRDGDLDVVVGSSTARDCAKSYPGGNEVHFYENKINDAAEKHGFLQIELEGKGSGGANKTGIGARVKVVNGGKVQSKQLLGGYGHFGIQHDTVLSFGLGATCEPTAIEVRWPNGELTRARYTGVGGGRRILIKETGEVTEVAK
jgi:hypothetical protein